MTCSSLWRLDIIFCTYGIISFRSFWYFEKLPTPFFKKWKCCAEIKMSFVFGISFKTCFIIIYSNSLWCKFLYVEIILTSRIRIYQVLYVFSPLWYHLHYTYTCHPHLQGCFQDVQRVHWKKKFVGGTYMYAIRFFRACSHNTIELLSLFVDVFLT